eukprot:TRINITY_DN2260_c0_g2_i14.p1 TRINITY_DN2260_c0_g2~~TRINITY_DN2260_c0_g2_i14.p1  ORF type:complete len:323 (+),score=47.25 TRINITY_DN2260_c0_g2_i14:82-1050(+)
MSDEIWLEKYRPKTLEEVQGNPDTITQLKVIAEEGNVPHMILVGPPGIGKTSSILCLARTLLKDQFQAAVLELNASDERGIDVVRDRIKSFAQKKVTLPEGLHKIIILDEADSLTDGAQQALRMIISDYSDTTRFVLSCNDSTKLIDAIQSRCAILRFAKLNDEQVLKRVTQIVQAENITCTKDGYEAIIFAADGDMRQAVNNLQATYSGFKLVNRENVFRVCDIPNIDALNKILDFCQNVDFASAQKEVFALWQEGYNAYDIINTMSRLIQNKTNMDKHLQFEYLKEIAQSKMRILEGLPTFLQVSGFLANACRVSASKRK